MAIRKWYLFVHLVRQRYPLMWSILQLQCKNKFFHAENSRREKYAGTPMVLTKWPSHKQKQFIVVCARKIDWISWFRRFCGKFFLFSLPPFEKSLSRWGWNPKNSYNLNIDVYPLSSEIWINERSWSKHKHVSFLPLFVVTTSILYAYTVLMNHELAHFRLQI